jgi:hypothetical protein
MSAISSLRFRPRSTPVNSPAGQKRLFLAEDGLLKTIDDEGNVQAVADGTGLPDAPSDTKQYARKDGAWVEVVAGSSAPTALTPSANVKFGAAAGAGITDVLSAAPAAGDRAKYYIKPTGDKTLDFDTAILKPTDSGLTLPKTMTSGKTYVVLMEFNGTAWMLVSLVGGY